MTTPETPLDKKDLKQEEEITLTEKVSRLEHTLENAYNQLGRYIHETELKLQKDSVALQAEISRTLTLMNMSTLQNIVAIRETIKALIAKNVVDEKELDKAITEELTKAIEAQQKIMAEAQDTYEKENVQKTA
jgi:hypothetical protein